VRSFFQSSPSRQAEAGRKQAPPEVRTRRDPRSADQRGTNEATSIHPPGEQPVGHQPVKRWRVPVSYFLVAADPEDAMGLTLASFFFYFNNTSINNENQVASAHVTSPRFDLFRYMGSSISRRVASLAQAQRATCDAGSGRC
jgi:hypothetical protein